MRATQLGGGTRQNALQWIFVTWEYACVNIYIGVRTM